MKKILFIATYGGFFTSFELNNMRILKNMGYHICCAANFSDKQHNERTQLLDEINPTIYNIEFVRNPLSFKNISCYKKLKKIMKVDEIYGIDTHNPVVSVFSRIAARKTHVKSVFYTAHGFFFYKGCSIKKKLFFKPVEKMMARLTDVLITINKEDYKAAQKMHVRKKAIYIPGIGVDLKKIDAINTSKAETRSKFGLAEDDFVVISVGEMIARKNYKTALEAIAKTNIPNLKYLICGAGDLLDDCKKLCKDLSIENKVMFLGFRYDVLNLMKASDMFLFSSYQEGLPVALMEAMACGLPAVVSRIRGNIDLIDDNFGGYLVEANDSQGFSNSIIKIYNNDNRKAISDYNKSKIEYFGIDNVSLMMEKVYKKYLGD